MKVALVSCTPEARELLLFTKQTRLSMDAGLMDEIRSWPEYKKTTELNYMLNTIESSWEFIDYVFSIQGVSRSFTHQFVRTRVNSFAQQSQRTVDMSDFEYVMPSAFESNDSLTPSDAEIFFHSAMEQAKQNYQALIQIGAAPQDARATLPEATSTNIIVKANLRSLSDTAKTRLCSRTQGEYQNVFRQMRKLVIEVHPWAEPFIRVACARLGVCAFPNYKECPIKPAVYNADTGRPWGVESESQLPGTTGQWPFPLIKPDTRSEIQARWENMRYEAVPKSEMKREGK